MRVRLGAISHFTLAVGDPNASAAWWMRNFELDEWFRVGERVALSNGSIIISLFPGKPDPAALGHLAFHASDMEQLRAALDALRGNGVDLEDPGDEIGPVAEGSSSMGLWFHDIDGYRWELFVQGPAET